MRAVDHELGAWLEAMPGAADLPFQVAPSRLYDICELYAGFDPGRPESLREVLDTRVYRWTRDRATGAPRALSVTEILASRLHDTAMDRHIAEFLAPRRTVTVGFMGGHDVSRADRAFAGVARIARTLRRRGFMIVTGGGPGLMEAANFGAFMAPFPDDRFDVALALLAAVPTYGDDTADDPADKSAWLGAAVKVRAQLLGRWDARTSAAGTSLGIPTWYYGAEPPNLFATAVGKYFFDSLREEGLVSVANGGLVFGKGAAGTVQEVFQNANLNYYRAIGVHPTPMVFLDRRFWSGALSEHGSKPVFALVRALAREARSPFADMLLLTDDESEAAAFVDAANAGKVERVRFADIRLGRC